MKEAYYRHDGPCGTYTSWSFGLRTKYLHGVDAVPYFGVIFSRFQQLQEVGIAPFGLSSFKTIVINKPEHRKEYGFKFKFATPSFVYVLGLRWSRRICS